jgi:hypothetical protein
MPQMYNSNMVRRHLPESKNSTGETIMGAKTGKSARPNLITSL